MALSKITSASVADTAVHGRRNHIINGGFQCWQRSEDKENTGNGWAYWSVDRFQSNKGRFRKTTDTVDGRTVNVLRIDPSSGVYNGGRGVFTLIEDWNVYDIKTTLSVWVKADAATTATLGFIYDYGTSSTAEAGTTINVTTSWQRFTITYDAQTFTQAAGHYLLSSLVDGRTYYVAMAQLEDGDTATPFEHRSYGEELALCQRYYQRYNSQEGSSGGVVGVYAQWNSNTAYLSLPFKTVMRSIPSFTKSSVGHFRAYQAGESGHLTSFNGLNATNHSCEFNCQASAPIDTAGQAGWVRFDNSGAWFAFDAEL